jgi:hypothetical protein
MHPQHDRLESQLARLAERSAALGLEQLATEEQQALVAYSAHGLVAKGGLKQFYEGPLPLGTLVTALRALKLNALANAAQATAAQFPDPGLAEDPLARRPHLAALNTDKQDYVFFRLSSEELLSSIAAFWKRAKPSPSL